MVRESVAKLAATVAGVRAVRVCPGVVSVPEIAALSDVDREKVRAWTRREDFPPMFDNLRGHKLWLWREIIDWVEAGTTAELEL